MFARFFVDRPIFATVLSLVIVVIGGVAFFRLPIAQYPEVAPPTVSVTASYPGADAKTVADTVATPIEQEVNGVERMLYMSSRCTNDGQMTLDVTFELGTNLDTAQVLVQNRVAIAMAKLPEEVKRIGVTTKKKSPSILLCVNLISEKRPDGSDYYDQIYLSNFASLNVKDDLARIKGVGDVVLLGARDYSMRIWLDPNKLASRSMTVTDVIGSIREQNVQVAAGRLGQPPVPPDVAVPFQVPLNAQGRLSAESQFEQIIVKTGEEGQAVYLRDLTSDPLIGPDGQPTQKGVQLGAKNYDMNSYLNGKPAVTIALFQLPGSNALQTADAIREKMEELKRQRFPKLLEGGEEKYTVDYAVVYDTTVFVEESIHEVYKTLFEAFVLVFIVVLVFLQDWRATLLPMIDVPVSLIGTFAVMTLLGFSLNNLTLFGLVLAIGIVVDDAIVVVENVERWMSKGLPPREATIKAMEEITGPVIAITLVLTSVFVPTAFLAGISGQFFRQFALTIAASTIISAINAMTMAPARAVVLIKPHTAGEHGETRQALPRLGIALIVGFVVYGLMASTLMSWLGLSASHAQSEEIQQASSPAAVWVARLGLLAVGSVLGWFVSPPVNRALGVFLGGFNWVFERLGHGYGLVVRSTLRVAAIALLIYAGLMGLTVLGLTSTPGGFIPDQDKGYLVLNAQLPEGASLDRSDKLIKQLSELTRQTPGVANTIDLPGYSTITGTNLSNAGGMFIILAPFEERKGKPELGAPAIAATLREKYSAFQEAQIGLFNAPPVEGIGNTGGFKLQVQDRRAAGLRELQGSVRALIDESRREPRLAGLFSTFSVAQPQLAIDIDRPKAKAQGVSLDEVHTALQAYLGSYYVNDFSFQNRNWQVNIQADPRFRMRPDDIGKLEVRNGSGDRVPLRTLILVRDTAGPLVVNHYNLYPSAEINGAAAPGTSSAEAIALMDQLAEQQLPSTMGSEWTELSLQEVLAQKDVLSKLVFPLAVLFVFMVLAAQYESWSLPLAILLIVPMCILSALIGIWIVRLDNNIFTQIGLVVLIGLAAKNAILVVEFARQRQREGRSRVDATVDACRARLRPILMTSFAFILGVVPLVLAKGAGAEMRVALGVAVFSGMVGVTIFGLLFTPVFYSAITWLAERRRGAAPAGHESAGT